MNKQQLASKIWESANKMRSKIEANEYKDYIPSDGFRSQIKNELKQNHGASVSRSTISFVDRS